MSFNENTETKNKIGNLIKSDLQHKNTKTHTQMKKGNSEILIYSCDMNNLKWKAEVETIAGDIAV